MDVVTGIAVGVVTLAVLVAALVTVGFVMLFRRRGDRDVEQSSDNSIGALGRRAGSLLVKLDDAMRDGDDELGYAMAQFGADKAKPYADAIAAARAKLTEAFRLKQSLDDAYPDSDQQRREWTLQVIALCEQADTLLSSQDKTFGDLRALEANAAGTLKDVRARIAASTARLDGTRSTIAGLTKNYVATTFAAIAQNPGEAEKLLASAAKSADAAEPGISQQGVSDVSGILQEAGRAAQHADQLLDAVDRTARDLAAADDALATLRSKTAADLVEAKAERDKAPDADTGKAIIDAIAGVEAILSAKSTGPADPVAALDGLGDAIAALDTALASARNQAERLEHARAAYAGTLVSVTSQISAAHDYIGRYGGGVDARTRLAEAERQLVIAKAEADPVDALDAVRRSVTLARDADALARYDTMGSHPAP
jgi:chromosome segregation ATPase